MLPSPEPSQQTAEWLGTPAVAAGCFVACTYTPNHGPPCQTPLMPINAVEVRQLSRSLKRNSCLGKGAQEIKGMEVQDLRRVMLDS